MQSVDIIRLTVLTGALVVATTAPASATSYIMVSDADLVSQATAIVEGRVVDSGPATAAGGMPNTAYTVEVDAVLKGAGVPGTIVVRVLGGEASDGARLKIWGAPVFERDEGVLLFLEEQPDGAYAPLHLMLGAFHEVDVRGQRLALRDLSETHEVEPRAAGDGTPEREHRVRDFDRFADWIAARARDDLRAADYFVPDPGPALVEVSEKFTLITDQNGRGFRWRTFDNGGNAVWRRQAGGNFGIANPAATIQAAMAAWNDERGTPIDYRLGGTTNNTNGFQQGDAVNSIIAEDPNRYIAGRVICGQGGVLAVGGPWAQGTHSWKGTTFWTSLNGDLITNDGFAACFGAGNPTGVAEVFAHELGHALGLGHSCGDTATPACTTSTKLADALMNAVVKNDGRGARLGADDLQGIRHLYAPTITPDTSPCTPNATTLCLTKGNRFEVTMDWGTGGALQPAKAVDFARDSGFFYFGNNSANLEALVKVLRACGINGHTWVFAALATNVEMELTVRDTETGAVKKYFDPPNHVADTINDTKAFENCM